MPRPVEGTSPYLPGLDGIRAVAVLSVILFHLNFGWASGGLLGVQVFFVLSGYLITDLLVSEYRRTRNIALKQFWIRRARRLLPALIVVLFVTVGWATLLDRGQLVALRTDVPAGLFYVSNWWFIFHHVSYFAEFGPPSPLGHLWSLSIEEQFYLVWPLAVLAAMKWIRNKRTVIALTAALAAVSAVEMWLLFTPDVNPTRVYDGTDTRAFALLIGAALAMALPRNQTFAPVTANARRLLDAVGACSLVGIFLMFGLTIQNAAFLYQGGMVVLALLTAILIGVTIHPGSHLQVVLGWEPLRWLGERSYGIYLWHYPVIVLTTPLNAPSSVLRASLQIAATLVLAALSWRYIEQPVRHGALGRQWHKVRTHQWAWPHLRPVGWVVAAAVAANSLLCVAGLFGVVSASASDPASQVIRIVPVTRPRPGPTTTSTTPSSIPLGATTTTTTTTAPPPGRGVLAIGDSIMVDAAADLQSALPGMNVYAQVGEQLTQVQAAVPQLKSAGAIGNRVIIELGTNGPFTPDQLTALLDSLGPMQRIVLVNTHVPRPWQQEVNDTIAAVAQSYPNTVVVDWNTVSGSTPQYFEPDGIHLDPDGAKYYASLLIQALDQPAVRPPG
jgi:peptidoglycan/LPS O-acetylase OafA/YrhL